MISSKELLVKTGISRATLNNYIKFGILSKPLLRQPPSGKDSAKLMGYFPDWVLDRILAVKEMKKRGISMAEIVSRLSEGNAGNAPADSSLVPIRPPIASPRPPTAPTAGREPPQVTTEPAFQVSTPMLELQSHRDPGLRDLLQKRLPALTPLAVMAAALQDSASICSELPPEEYFELINDIWKTIGPVFQKYFGTSGELAGDRLVRYFFPQPDTSYAMNALMCACELKLAIRQVSKQWQLRKNWPTELYLNIGLHEGQEWLGTFQSDSRIEIAVLGDTIEHAARISEFARFGAIWASKDLVSKLLPQERDTLNFGISRRGDDERDHFVSSSYSRISSLIDTKREGNEHLREIAALAITEIRSVQGMKS